MLPPLRDAVPNAAPLTSSKRWHHPHNSSYQITIAMRTWSSTWRHHPLTVLPMQRRLHISKHYHHIKERCNAYAYAGMVPSHADASSQHNAPHDVHKLTLHPNNHHQDEGAMPTRSSTWRRRSQAQFQMHHHPCPCKHWRHIKSTSSNITMRCARYFGVAPSLMDAVLNTTPPTPPKY